MIPSLMGGGAERQLSYLAPELSRRGHEVHVAYLTDSPSDWEETAEVRFHRLADSSPPRSATTSPRNYDPRNLFRLIRLLKDTRANVVQSWIPQSDILCAIAAQFTGCRWILREPSASFESHSPKMALRKRLAGLAAAVVANSDEGVRYWTDRNPPIKARLIPNGVPAEKLREIAPAEGNGRAYILAAGRLQPYKNTQTVARAFAEVLMTADVEVEADIAGGGPEAAALAELISQLKADRLRLLGEVKDPFPLMRRASVFVTLSTLEGCPNALLEAMACECAVVASDIPQHRAVLSGHAGRLVAAHDWRAASAAICDLLMNETGEAEKRRAAARAMHFRVASMADQYEALYREVLS